MNSISNSKPHVTYEGGWGKAREKCAYNNG